MTNHFWKRRISFKSDTKSVSEKSFQLYTESLHVRFDFAMAQKLSDVV